MIDGATRLLGVLGWPVAHSLSPVMHNAAIRTARLNARYLPLPCPPAALRDAIAGLRAVGFLGANLTVPHKQAVIDHLDGLSEESCFTGSVNTLYWEGDRLMGTTTDAPGALLNLREAGIGLDGRRVVILGAGGAARALAFSLARGSCAGPGGSVARFRLPELVILGRDAARADRLAQEIAEGTAGAAVPVRGRTDRGAGARRLAAGSGGGAAAAPGAAVTYGGEGPPPGAAAPGDEEAPPTAAANHGAPVRSGLLAEFADFVGGAALVINCTSAGMAPDVDGCPIDPAPLAPRHIVYDIVYQPRETRLLREAGRRGCRTLGGIGMLAHQGAASFRVWFGRDPDTEAMFTALGQAGYRR